MSWKYATAQGKPNKGRTRKICVCGAHSRQRSWQRHRRTRWRQREAPR